MLFFLNKNYEENVENFSLEVKINGPILENVNDGILNINTEKLYREYYSCNFNENSFRKYENLHNDFKITLKMIESLKNEYRIESNQNQNQTQNSKSESGKVNNPKGKTMNI